MAKSLMTLELAWPLLKEWGEPLDVGEASELLETSADDTIEVLEALAQRGFVSKLDMDGWMWEIVSDEDQPAFAAYLDGLYGRAAPDDPTLLDSYQHGCEIAALTTPLHILEGGCSNPGHSTAQLQLVR